MNLIIKSFSAIVVLMLCTTVPASENIIAWIDDVPVEKSRMYPEARRLLPVESDPSDIRQIKINSAIRVEMKLRTTFDILSEGHIECNRQSAVKYIEMRCKPFGKAAREFKTALLKMQDSKEFQLKCAMYFYILKFFPEKLSCNREKLLDFYHANQVKYMKSTPGRYTIIKLDKSVENPMEKLNSIRLAMLQGESAVSAAKAHNCSVSPVAPQETVLFDRLNLNENDVSPVIPLGNHLCVALCLEKPRKDFIPFEKLEPFIEEELMSHISGAAFDQILQKKLSGKVIKYRR